MRKPSIEEDDRKSKRRRKFLQYEITERRKGRDRRKGFDRRGGFDRRVGFDRRRDQNEGTMEHKNITRD